MEKKYLTIKEAAKKLGVSSLTLRNWDNAGKLTAYRHPINNYRVYLAMEIDEIISKIENGEKPLKHSREPKKSVKKSHTKNSDSGVIHIHSVKCECEEHHH
ncbi:MAG TPA: MerR family DNA-binding transcriptional regulator [Candidatus Paceibacterota bacterium]|nr:MerR family DNA-binding transcriptional regulator [Candidatus Paceibacterota bacterium]